MQDAVRQPLLEVRGLSAFFRTGRGEVQVTRDVSFAMAPGEMVGLVGESGCGKTVTGLALMGLLPPASSRLEGQILLQGQDLVTMAPAAKRRLRGRRISMIFQEPMSALDPVFTIGHQIAETLRAHQDVSRAEARNRAIASMGVAW